MDKTPHVLQVKGPELTVCKQVLGVFFPLFSLPLSLLREVIVNPVDSCIRVCYGCQFS
jgi:hypothetical protein